MKLRKTIATAIDMLVAESSKNVSETDKVLKFKSWHIGLDDVTDEQIMSGLSRALKSTTGFLMSCGEFRKLCIADNNSISLDEQASKAWVIVRNNLNSYISPYFADSVIAESLRRMGGWKRLCMMETRNEHFERDNFLSIYKTVKNAGKSNFDNYLTGTFGMKNIKPVGYEANNLPKIDDIKQKLLIERKTQTKVLKMLTDKMED